MSRAHGKVILIGEHAVVYNKPAIALPLVSATVHTTLTPHDIMMIESPLYTGEMREAPQMLSPLTELVHALRSYFQRGPYTITIHSTIPLRAGFGSSAAIAASIIRAFYEDHAVTLSNHALYQWLHMSETMAHGTPSGIDAYAVTNDHPFEFIKDDTPKPLNLPAKGHLVITHSGEQGQTKKAVQMVREKLENNKGKANIDTIETATQDAKAALKRGDLHAMGHSLNAAHACLDDLGLCTNEVNIRVDAAREAGALGAKMSGGGLGGAVIALAENEQIAGDIVNVFKQWTDDVFTLNFKEDFYAER